MKKRILLVTTVVLVLALILSGCSKMKLNSLLESKDYQAAYDITSGEERNKVVIESFFDYCYGKALEQMNWDFYSNGYKFNGGWVGVVEATQYDTYESNDPASAMTNYQKLAEYISMLTGTDVLNQYYYALIQLNGSYYYLVQYQIDNGNINIKQMDHDLEQTFNDNDIDAFYKFVARYVKQHGVTIEQEGMERISGAEPTTSFVFELTDRELKK